MGAPADVWSREVTGVGAGEQRRENGGRKERKLREWERIRRDVGGARKGKGEGTGTRGVERERGGRRD